MQARTKKYDCMHQLAAHSSTADDAPHKQLRNNPAEATRLPAPAASGRAALLHAVLGTHACEQQEMKQAHPCSSAVSSSQDDKTDAKLALPSIAEGVAATQLRDAQLKMQAAAPHHKWCICVWPAVLVKIKPSAIAWHLVCLQVTPACRECLCAPLAQHTPRIEVMLSSAANTKNARGQLLAPANTTAVPGVLRKPPKHHCTPNEPITALVLLCNKVSLPTQKECIHRHTQLTSAANKHALPHTPTSVTLACSSNPLVQDSTCRQIASHMSLPLSRRQYYRAQMQLRIGSLAATYGKTNSA
jgi:hypothetical protein